MTDNRTSFLLLAELAVAGAEKATDNHVKRQFLAVAEQWRRLARPQGRWADAAEENEFT